MTRGHRLSRPARRPIAAAVLRPHSLKHNKTESRKEMVVYMCVGVCANAKKQSASRHNMNWCRMVSKGYYNLKGH